MNGSRHVVGSTSRACPPYRGVVVVDAEAFSKVQSMEMPALSADIRHVLETAFHRCGLGAVWDERRFPDGTGDGVVFGVWPEDLPFVIHPLLDTLQEVLEEHDRVLRVRSRDLRLRLRVSIHIGPIPDLGVPEWDRISTPTIDSFRIADAPAVKQQLKTADPNVTLLVAMLSQRVYEDLVLGGYVGIHPSRFIQVNADVPEKDFAHAAWMYIPRPSQRLGAAMTPAKADGHEGSPVSPDRSVQDAAASVSPVYHGDVENAINAGQISGGFTITGRGASPEGRGKK